ncbi:hypothetical protein MHH94_10125 [Mammaliicoccus sp. FSL K6-3158]|uniref:hypothetical protein n=1 Tax=Mammaliicoccus sp. FSL K6-3158 TaxID=2921491 RepID=UPI0030FC2295
MPTIKTKKEMNLPELIEWAEKNKVTNQIFRADKQLMNIQFDEDGDFKTYGFTGNDTTFTVEVEIAKCTKVPKLLAIFKYNERTYSEIHENKSINEILQLDRKLENSFTRSIHMFENDETLTLIWRDGKLVE